jgi:hypothetical protein
MDIPTLLSKVSNSCANSAHVSRNMLELDDVYRYVCSNNINNMAIGANKVINCIKLKFRAAL